MEDLLAEMERCLRGIYDTGDSESSTASAAETGMLTNSSGYQSCIRRNGKPILPPLMTAEKRSMMRQYREAAMEKEKLLLSRKERLKTMGHQQHEQDQPDLSLGLGKPHHAFPHQSQEELPGGSKEQTTTDQIFVDASVNLPDNSRIQSQSEDRPGSVTLYSFKGGGVVCDITVGVGASDEMPGSEAGMAGSLPSTNSSSEVSVLNQTVINLSELHEQEEGAEEDKLSRSGSSNQSEAGTIVARTSKSSVAGTESQVHQIDRVVEKVGTEKRDEFERKMEKVVVELGGEDGPEPSRTPGEERSCDQKYLAGTSSLMQSFSDTESFLSFVGDYNKLPTPTPSSGTPDVLEDLKVVGDGVESDARNAKDGGGHPVKRSSDMGEAREEKGSSSIGKSGHLGGRDCSPPSGLGHTPDGLSTMDTNASSLGSLAQSCTLPISMTESCDSTLADISERLDTPSIMDELPRDPNASEDPRATGDQGCKDTSGSGSDSSVPITIRKGPVGQEAEGARWGDLGKTRGKLDGDRKEETWLTGNVGTRVTAPPEELSPPVGRVRKNSYTLETPSPALLDAKARSNKQQSGVEGNELPDVGTRGEDLSSSVRRVRKNSYTLDIASPALLDAKARNEAPYALSLDTAENSQRNGNEEHQEGGEEKRELPGTRAEEVTLVSQLELLEEIKRRLAEEQKQQLTELLERQKKEQWLLQQEMADVQRQVIASRTGSERNDDPRMTPDNLDGVDSGRDRNDLWQVVAGSEQNDYPRMTPDNLDEVNSGRDRNDHWQVVTSKTGSEQNDDPRMTPDNSDRVDSGRDRDDHWQVVAGSEQDGYPGMTPGYPKWVSSGQEREHGWIPDDQGRLMSSTAGSEQNGYLRMTRGDPERVGSGQGREPNSVTDDNGYHVGERVGMNHGVQEGNRGLAVGAPSSSEQNGGGRATMDDHGKKPVTCTAGSSQGRNRLTEDQMNSCSGPHRGGVGHYQDDRHSYSTVDVLREPRTLTPLQNGTLDMDQISSEATSVQDSLEQAPTIDRGHSTTGPPTDSWGHTMAVLARQRTPIRSEQSPPSAYFSSESLRAGDPEPLNDPEGVSGFYLRDGGEMVEEARIGYSQNASEYPVDLDVKYDRISAAAKGFLTRRLMATIRVQEIVKTIKDSNAFILRLQTETPIKGGTISTQDAALAQRILNQMRAARFELHDIFHSLSPASRMSLLHQDREAARQLAETRKSKTDDIPSRPLSAATLKALERKKKAKEAEKKKPFQEKVRGPSIDALRPKSAPNTRILKTLQGHEAPSFPTRPVSSAAYRSNRVNQNPKPVRITAGSKAVNRTDSNINSTTYRPKQNAPVTTTVTTKPSSVRRVLYPAPANSTKKIIRKQATKKPFKL